MLKDEGLIEGMAEWTIEKLDLEAELASYLDAIRASYEESEEEATEENAPRFAAVSYSKTLQRVEAVQIIQLESSGMIGTTTAYQSVCKAQFDLSELNYGLTEVEEFLMNRGMKIQGEWSISNSDDEDTICHVRLEEQTDEDFMNSIGVSME